MVDVLLVTVTSTVLVSLKLYLSMPFLCVDFYLSMKFLCVDLYISMSFLCVGLQIPVSCGFNPATLILLTGLSSTAKHLHLYNALGWEPPKFAHMPLLINLDDRSKLSKRQQDLRLEELEHRGILPEALVNFVAFLGWKSPAGQTEIFNDIIDIARVFDLSNVSKAPAVVDMRKLSFINKQHMALLRPNSPTLAQVLDTFHPLVR